MSKGNIATSMSGGNRRVLLATLAFAGGGVNTMAKFAVSLLREKHFEPVAACYLAYSVDPSASVPIWALPFRRPRARAYRDEDGLEIHEIGAWFPEFEFLHEYPHGAWKELVACSRHNIAVVGSPVGALPFHRLGVPHLVWAATPWLDDRVARKSSINIGRRTLDALMNGPLCRALEKRIVREGKTVALSVYTRNALNRLAGGRFVREVLPVPPEKSLFFPEPGHVIPGRIGFVGRLLDSRKNVALLFEALALCRRQGLDVKGYVVGGRGCLTPETFGMLRMHGMEDSITVIPFLARHRLRDFLRTLDLFVLPSRQEGLCIAALEAMACGIPIVSTKCGGPEEFVHEGVNGFLVSHTAEEMASRISEIVSNRVLRESLSRGAIETISADYSRKRCAAAFWAAFDEQFGG